ncbi:MAG: cytochrome c [Rhodobacterales bacterium]|nr:cytochrome c [Rhodobacterales bacterium]
MKRTLLSALAGLLVAGAAANALADDMEKAIEARQGLMELYAFNIGRLAAMAKGEMPYDAGQASAAAGNLLAAATMKNGALWPKGSDLGAPGLAGKTRAKPEIWSTYPKVAERGKALAEAAAVMAAEAGNGLDAVRANLGNVGKACKGCHDDFRAPKK